MPTEKPSLSTKKPEPLSRNTSEGDLKKTQDSPSSLKTISDLKKNSLREWLLGRVAQEHSETPEEISEEELRRFKYNQRARELLKHYMNKTK